MQMQILCHKQNLQMQTTGVTSFQTYIEKSFFPIVLLMWLLSLKHELSHSTNHISELS